MWFDMLSSEFSGGIMVDTPSPTPSWFSGKWRSVWKETTIGDIPIFFSEPWFLGEGYLPIITNPCDSPMRHTQGGLPWLNLKPNSRSSALHLLLEPHAVGAASYDSDRWVFPKIGVPQKWMVKIMENPIKMDDLGYHYFSKHPDDFNCWSLALNGHISHRSREVRKIIDSKVPICSFPGG